MEDDQSLKSKSPAESAGPDQYPEQSSVSDSRSNSEEEPSTLGQLKRFFRESSKFCSMSLVIITIASLFAPFSTLCELLCHFRVHYIVLLVVSALLLLVLRVKSFFVAALFALLFNLSQLLPFYIPIRRATDTNLQVMTINVNSRNANFQHVADVLDQSNADLICLQELHPQMSQYLASHLKSYPHQFVRPRPDNFGIGIYSRHPLKDTASIPIPKRLLPNESFGGPVPEVDILKAVATINGSDITFLDVHPMSPMAEDLSTWRNDGLSKIAELSKAVDGSVIVAGDLNCTRFSPYFGKLLEGGALHDSEEGFGLQPTWPCQIPILSMPIDHILYKGLLTVSSRVLGPVTGSDHRPVVVSFWHGRLPK